MFEIIKYEIVQKSNRIADDPPEVIAYADSRSEAEAMAHDLQVNIYRYSAYITVRRAGDSTPTLPGSDLSISYCNMTVEGFEGERFGMEAFSPSISPLRRHRFGWCHETT
jgi:hypothetical protein